MKKSKYLFSVVVPLYNSGDYIEECIESIVNQTIGFQNIQLILINNESLDEKDEQISLIYKNKYPNNIVYIKQPNNRYFMFRQKGIEYVEGEYVQFTDADDKFQLDTFEQVYDFFKNNDVNIVIVPAEYFDFRSGMVSGHLENFETGVKDIVFIEDFMLNDHWYTFFSSNLLLKLDIFKRNIVTGRCMTNALIVSERYFGYVSTSRYLYRKRSNQNLAIDLVYKNYDSSYILYMILNEYLMLLENTLNLSLKIYGFILTYLKNWVFSVLEYEILSYKFNYENENWSSFMKASNFIYKFINYIMEYDNILDNSSIFNSKLSNYKKLFLLNFKYKPIDKKNNKIDIKYLIQKGILRDRPEEYFSLEYNKINLDEFKNILVQFCIITPIDINIEKVICETEDFENDAILQGTENIQIWDEICFIKYKYILKIDSNIPRGQVIKFWVQIDKIQYAFISLLEIK